jgi:hypothetical protein
MAPVERGIDAREKKKNKRMSEKRSIITGKVSAQKLAEHLGLNPATASVVLNDLPGHSISPATRDCIEAAAKELNYHPCFLAHSLAIAAPVSAVAGHERIDVVTRRLNRK